VKGTHPNVVSGAVHGAHVHGRTTQTTLIHITGDRAAQTWEAPITTTRREGVNERGEPSIEYGNLLFTGMCCFFTSNANATIEPDSNL
jgi:hypothetical protein